jgi:cellulose synthase/poly-beta-1,6-N-acetylglucosamine synthase-like glycosyltransferase
MSPVINMLMWAFGVISFILLLFITFTGVIILISLFKKPKYKKYAPKVSIVIPVHNESKNIEKCLKKIFSSTYPKNMYEIIVVDDGSTDNTVQLVHRFKDVKLINMAHGGKSAALNHGIKNCRYDIVLTIDADTMLQREALAKIVVPFSDASVGAAIGTYKVGNRKNMLTAFQVIEYSYNNLIRMGFSRLFKDSVWFYGAMSCYRKSALENVGRIHADTLTEDMDVAIRLQNKGYKIIHVHDAYSTTVVPETIKGFFNQRIRWWTGVLQSMRKNSKQSYKNIFQRKNVSDVSKQSKIPLIFVYLSQWWWSIFALVSFPMFLIQIMYWLPYNLATFMDTFMYLFRWFSLLGPVYSIYMIPEWGVNFFSIFGILAGLISVTFIIVSVTIFRDNVRPDNVGLREMLAIFFYFPYTLMLNTVILVSVAKYIFADARGFVK